MKTSTRHREWVIGLFEKADSAEKAIKEGLKQGIDAEEMTILCPPQMKRKSFAGIKPDSLHPEIRRALIGAGIGFLIASVGVHFLLIQGAPMSSNVAMDIAAAFIRGFGGAVLGAIFGMVGSGVDATLNTYYEDEGGNNILVAIRCEPGNMRMLKKANAVIRKGGGFPRRAACRIKRLGSGGRFRPRLT